MLRGAVIFFTFAAFTSAAEPTWGDAVDGLRIGLVAENTKLHVVYENVSSAAKELVIGAIARDPAYFVSFQARHKNGKSCEVLNLAGPGGVAGLISHIVITIAAGKTYDLELPMSKLICVENRIDIPLNVLLERGYSVRATFKAEQLSAAYAHLHWPWIAEVRSGELSRPPR